MLVVSALVSCGMTPSGMVSFSAIESCGGRPAKQSPASKRRKDGHEFVGMLRLGIVDFGTLFGPAPLDVDPRWETSYRSPLRSPGLRVRSRNTDPSGRDVAEMSAILTPNTQISPRR